MLGWEMIGLSSKVASFNFGLDFWYQELLGHGGLFDIPQPVNQTRSYNYTANTISNIITNQHHHDHHLQQQQQLQNHSPRLSCPRCHSSNTKFCYFNNYSKSQPRHFCKCCKRHWTAGGTLRNIPVGGGRKNKRLKTNNNTTSSSSSAATSATNAASPSIAIQNSGIASSTGITSVPQSTQVANKSSSLQFNGDHIRNIFPEILGKVVINSQSQLQFQQRSSPTSNRIPSNHFFSSQFQPAINNSYDNLDDTMFSISSFRPSVSMSKDQEIVTADATVTATTSTTASLPAVNSAWQGQSVINDSFLTPTIATGYWSCWDDDMASITIGGDDSHFQP